MFPTKDVQTIAESELLTAVRENIGNVRLDTHVKQLNADEEHIECLGYIPFRINGTHEHKLEAQLKASWYKNLDKLFADEITHRLGVREEDGRIAPRVWRHAYQPVYYIGAYYTKVRRT